MAEDLKGYDGAVDGLQILRGIAVAEPWMPIRTSQVRQPQPGVEPIVQRAVEVIGGPEEAMRWLGTPVRALGYATPVSRLHDPTGRAQVLSVLAQLEHGVL